MDAVVSATQPCPLAALIPPTRSCQPPPPPQPPAGSGCASDARRPSAAQHRIQPDAVPAARDGGAARLRARDAPASEPRLWGHAVGSGRAARPPGTRRVRLRRALSRARLIRLVRLGLAATHPSHGGRAQVRATKRMRRQADAPSPPTCVACPVPRSPWQLPQWKPPSWAAPALEVASAWLQSASQSFDTFGSTQGLGHDLADGVAAVTVGNEPSRERRRSPAASPAGASAEAHLTATEWR